MAGYAFRTLQARQNLQTLWEQGNTAKDLAAALKVPLSTVYTELRRGRTGAGSRTSASSMTPHKPSSQCSRSLSGGERRAAAEA